jgi:tetratricopeptide (TPR) repeat protein
MATWILGLWRMCRNRFILSAVVLAIIFLVPPAIAIDWSKNDNVKMPPGAPLGWVHWWAAQEYLKEGNCRGAMNESSYLLKNPKFSNAEYSQKALILHGECYEKLGRLDMAFKAYLRALKQFGKNYSAFMHLADLYLHEENPKAAITAYRGGDDERREC